MTVHSLTLNFFARCLPSWACAALLSNWGTWASENSKSAEGLLRCCAQVHKSNLENPTFSEMTSTKFRKAPSLTTRLHESDIWQTWGVRLQQKNHSLFTSFQSGGCASFLAAGWAIWRSATMGPNLCQKECHIECQSIYKGVVLKYDSVVGV